MRHPNYVNKAATQIRRCWGSVCGPRLPRTVAGWQTLCHDLGLPVAPMEDCPAGFTARLYYDPAMRREWFAGYNPRASDRQIMRWLAHELGEWMAIRAFPSVFDGLPNQVHAYTGGSDPDDARHRIARRVESLCFRR